MSDYAWIAAEDTALRLADEIKYHVALLALGYLAFYDFNRFGDVFAAVVEQAVYFLYRGDSFGGETTAAKAYSVDTCIAYRLTCGFDERGDVFVDEGSALHHDMAADMAELVDKAAAADDGEIVDHNFAGELAGVADDHVVAHDAVVRHMAVGHDEAVAAYYSTAFGCCAAVDGHAFAQHCVIAYFCCRLLAAELEVLRYGAYHSAGEDGDVAADTGSLEDGDIAAYACAGADFNITVDGCERTDNDVVGYLGFRVDAC